MSPPNRLLPPPVPRPEIEALDERMDIPPRERVGVVPLRLGPRTDSVEFAVTTRGQRFSSVGTLVIQGVHVLGRVQLGPGDATDLIQLLKGERRKCRHGFRGRDSVTLTLGQADVLLHEGVPANLAERLRALIEQPPRAGEVEVPLTTTERQNIARRSMKEAAMAAGITDAPPHNLRHTMAATPHGREEGQ